MSDSAVNGQIAFTIAGEKHVVDISSIKNTVAFERHFDVSAQVLAMSPRLEYIAFMAYTAASSAGQKVPDTFDGFLDVVDDLEILDESPEKANPTDGGQSAEH